MLTEQHKWKKLKTIPLPCQDSDMQIYMATAFAFNDRLTNLTLRLRPLGSRDFLFERKMHVDLLSYLSKFKCLKSLFLHKSNDFKLEEIDEFLNNCPKLNMLAFFELREDNGNTPVPSVGLLDKIKLFKPKTALRKLVCDVTNDGGDETLTYIMRVLPNLETVLFNQGIGLSDEKRNMIYSAPVLISFLQYGFSKKTFDVRFLSCEDVGVVLSAYFQSKAYKATSKKEISLTIEGTRAFEITSTIKPAIYVSRDSEVMVDYANLEGASTPVELLEKVGSCLTNLVIKFASQNSPGISEETTAMYQGYFLDCVFEYCPLLKKLDFSFDKLQYCNPELSTNTSIEELYLYRSEVNPAALYQLSVRLPNLKRMTFTENEFISFNGSQLKGKKMVIDMPYTNFDELEINQKRHRNFLYFFLKYSNETGDRYFYSELEPGFTKLIKCTMDYYTRKLDSKKCFFFHLRCRAVRDLVIIFDETNMTL